MPGDGCSPLKDAYSVCPTKLGGYGERRRKRLGLKEYPTDPKVYMLILPQFSPLRYGIHELLPNDHEDSQGIPGKYTNTSDYP